MSDPFGEQVWMLTVGEQEQEPSSAARKFEWEQVLVGQR